MKPTISSIKFAQDFSIRHSDLLKKIRSFKCSNDFNQRNFSLVEYVDQKGQKRPMYEITQQGFTFLISRTSGRINDQYVEVYINAYEEMALKIAHEEKSLYSQLNKLTLQYMLADQSASDAGKNLNYFGKIAKPKLKQKIVEILDQLQLRLPLVDVKSN